MTNRAGFLMVLLALTACGKGAQVKSKGNATVTAPLTTNLSPTTGTEEKKTPANSMDIRNLVQGQLTQISKKDFEEMSKDLPFENSGLDTDAIRSVEAPTCHTPVDHVRSSNVLFRAVTYMPDPSEIVGVQRAVIRFKGLRRYSVDSDSNNNTLKNQILCLYDQRVCSGRSDTADLKEDFLQGKTFVSDEFSDQSLETINADGYGHVLSTTKFAPGRNEGELEFDLRELFHVESLDVPHFAEWLINNSSQYSENGFRKFRFVLGNNVYFESGELILQFATRAGKVAPTMPENVLALASDAEAYEFQAGKCASARPVAKETVRFNHKRTGSKTPGISAYYSSDDLTGLGNVANALARHASEIEKINLIGVATKSSWAPKAAEYARDHMKTSANALRTVLDAGTISGVVANREIRMEIILKGSSRAAALKTQIEQELQSAWRN